MERPATGLPAPSSLYQELLWESTYVLFRGLLLLSSSFFRRTIEATSLHWLLLLLQLLLVLRLPIVLQRWRREWIGIGWIAHVGEGVLGLGVVGQGFE